MGPKAETRMKPLDPSKKYDWAQRVYAKGEWVWKPSHSGATAMNLMEIEQRMCGSLEPKFIIMGNEVHEFFRLGSTSWHIVYRAAIIQ